MKMVKALVVSAGMLMAGGSALASQRVDADDLLGTWNATIEGDDGSGSVRVVFLDNGSYLALAMFDGADEPVPFWEIGEWEVDDDTLSMEATASSESDDGDDATTELTIESLEDGILSLSNEDDPMWEELEFEHWVNPFVGVWEGETEEGTALFLMDAGGGFAGGFGDDPDTMETFWGTWTADDDELTLAATDEDWDPESEPEMEEVTGSIEEIDDESMVTVIEELNEDEIEWERVAMDPLHGEWVGDVGEMTITFVIGEDSTFQIGMENDGEEQSFEGIWTVIGPGQMFLAITGDGPEPTVLRFVLTSPGTAMFGEDMDDMELFERK